MKLQKNTELALYSVLEFAARPDEHVPAAEVAAKTRSMQPSPSARTRTSCFWPVTPTASTFSPAPTRSIRVPPPMLAVDVIRLFEDLGAGAPAAPEGRTPVDRALGQVLAEIDQIAQATFGSITVATMLGMVDRAATPAP